MDTTRDCIPSMRIVTGVLIALGLTQAALAVDIDVPKSGSVTENAPPELAQPSTSVPKNTGAGDAAVADAKIIQQCEKAAQAGDPKAQTQLGIFYLKGVGVEPSPETAVHWFQLAAASGYPRASVEMGVLFVWGYGVRKDEQFAAQLFREAAEKGDGAGALFLGDLYFFGKGVPQDRSLAESWFRKAIKLHEPGAAYTLGVLASGEYGHAVDLHKAVELLKKAASADYIPAMHALALLYIRNQQLGKTPADVMPLLEKASDAGYWKSTIMLGVLERDGKGEKQDTEAAYYHFRLAMLQGGDQAKVLLANDVRTLAAQLPSEKAALIATRADAWFREHSTSVLVAQSKLSPQPLTFGSFLPPSAVQGTKPAIPALPPPA